MARSDLLLSLVRSATAGDDQLFTRTVEAIVAEERAKQHHVLADQLAANLRTPAPRPPKGRPTTDTGGLQFVAEVSPRRKLGDLILPEVVRTVANEVIEEHHRVDLLRSYNLEPRHRILLVGPPGNGKTSLAEALAEALFVPLFVVRYDALIGSYLGETASRLRQLFDDVRMQQCVLFFDEFDVVGKERGDAQETGEIKRVVSQLLLQIDALPSHVVVVTATNHPELLDRAVWRRFQVRLLLPAPERAQVEEWFRRFVVRFGQPLGHSPRALAERLAGASFSEVEEFAADVQRRFVLMQPQANVRAIVGQRLQQWEARVSAVGAAENG